MIQENYAATHKRSVFGLCFQRYMCLKLSIARTGRSRTVRPRCFRGCVNTWPLAVRKLTESEMQVYLFEQVQYMVHQYRSIISIYQQKSVAIHVKNVVCDGILSKN